MKKKLLLLIFMVIGNIIAYAQNKKSIVKLKNGTEFIGVIKSIDPNGSLIMEIAGIETAFKVADVAKVEEEKDNYITNNNRNSDKNEDNLNDNSVQSFIAVTGNDRLCFKILSKMNNTVEVMFNKNITFRNRNCIIPASVEYGGNKYTVVSIGKEAFIKNNNIEKVVIPGTVKTIGEEAFEYCKHLKVVVFSKGLERIEKEAFKACPVEKIDLPSTVTYIGLRAFFSANANITFKSKIKWVSIPESVEEIGKQAFSKCVNTFGKSFASSCHIDLLPSWINEEEADRIGLDENSYRDYKNKNN